MVQIPHLVYIVDKSEEVPTLEITQPKVIWNILQFKEQTLIYRFIGFCPKTKYILPWIGSEWPEESQVLLSSKGFFLVIFPSQEDLLSVTRKGPWFWGFAGLFITPWFPKFDPLTMVVTKVPIWVQLLNLPIHF